MTIFDDEFNRIFKKMSNSFFNIDDVFEDFNKGTSSGPFYYGYTMTIGPDGKPVVKEYGNVKPELAPTSNLREPMVDSIVDEKEKKVKLVAEMPGVEKSDVKIVVKDKLVDISAEHGEKKYHVNVPIKYKVDENSAKASYKNGILELVFNLVEDEKPKGKTVEVE
ncbi:MAG: Hsp20 family protein [Nitrososphaeria archaeon]|nr:Hsp20 family protein [Nitrosopumilaceae archaeon]NIP09135.1 Hsp20 family protein [Nitrosopumilaceae archaeon]NIP91663.1 Hsp20 family protein [Nitrososphaeria archaeon]NIS95503.1 Hsp20 family protein [Nitrosopumilaceae archaeon]